MGEGFINAAVAAATAIVSVAIVAVIVSRNSNTSGVIQAAASGFNNALSVAVSPVTGGTTQANLNYPGSSGNAVNNGIGSILGNGLGSVFSGAGYADTGAGSF